MKVLMVNKYLCPKGGSETYIFKLGDYLSSQGHEVQFFGMDDESRIVGNHIGSYSSNMDFHGGSKLKKLSYPFKVIYNGSARKKIRLVLNDFQPDVVHLNNFSYQLTPSIILEIVRWRKDNNKKCRIVFTAHDYNLVCPNHMLNIPSTKKNCEKCLGGHFFNCTRNKCIHNSMARSLIGTSEGFFWKWKGTYKYIDDVICPSAFLKDKMDTNPLLNGKAIVLHNFIEKPEIVERTKKQYVLYFGKLEDEKGINTLVSACKELPDIQFVFAGTGALASLLNGVSNINAVGFQTGDSLKRLISEAKFSICPSEWYENCPFSILESQSLGTPVIGSRIGGIPELIHHKKDGLLFDPGNTEQLINSINELWNDPDMIERFSEECLMIPYLGLAEYCDKLLAIYENRKVS